MQDMASVQRMVSRGEEVIECVFSLHRHETLRQSLLLPGWDVGMPFPFAVLLLIASPAIALIRGPFRRRRRGLCLRCGYDLACNVSGVCPECGTAISEQ